MLHAPYGDDKFSSQIWFKKLSHYHRYGLFKEIQNKIWTMGELMGLGDGNEEKKENSCQFSKILYGKCCNSRHDYKYWSIY